MHVEAVSVENYGGPSFPLPRLVALFGVSEKCTLAYPHGKRGLVTVSAIGVKHSINISLLDFF